MKQTPVPPDLSVALRRNRRHHLSLARGPGDEDGAEPKDPREPPPAIVLANPSGFSRSVMLAAGAPSTPSLTVWLHFEACGRAAVGDPGLGGNASSL